MNELTLLFSFLFGASLNKFNTISGMARLEDFTVPKAIAVVVGVGAILLSIEIGFGFASYRIKLLLLAGIAIGGGNFGSGAILGYCPGTVAVSLGEGSLDALVGIIGGNAGGIVYTLIQPSVQGMLGPHLGKHSLQSVLRGGSLFYILVFASGAALVAVAFWLNMMERKKNFNLLYAGIGLAILNCIVFLTTVFDRQVSASTTFPYVGDFMVRLTQNEYFTSIEKPYTEKLVVSE